MNDWWTVFARASAQGSKSTALQPLAWAMGLSLAALLGAVQLQAPDWVLVLLGLFAGLFALLFAAAYVYFMLNKPEALRSERYTLAKMQLERGLLGDTRTGFINADRPAVVQLPAGNPEQKVIATREDAE